MLRVNLKLLSTHRSRLTGTTNALWYVGQVHVILVRVPTPVRYREGNCANADQAFSLRRVTIWIFTGLPLRRKKITYDILPACHNGTRK